MSKKFFYYAKRNVNHCVSSLNNIEFRFLENVKQTQKKDALLYWELSVFDDFGSKSSNIWHNYHRII